MTTILRLHEKAQEAWNATSAAFFRTGQWDRHLVDRYLDIEATLHWEESKLALDAQLAADHDYHLHFGEPHPDCTDCQERSGLEWLDAMRNY